MKKVNKEIMSAINIGGSNMAHRHFICKLNDAIDTMEEDVSSHKADLDDYDRGHDEGYLAGLNYAKNLYERIIKL